jgi:hypothetical protein
MEILDKKKIVDLFPCILNKVRAPDNYVHLLHWHRYEDQLQHIDGSFRAFQELEYPSQIRDIDHGLGVVIDCKGLILLTAIAQLSLGLLVYGGISYIYLGLGLPNNSLYRCLLVI